MPTSVLRLKSGDRVRLRKAHPCGGDVWEILRAGIDVKARCLTCQHEVRIERVRFERLVKRWMPQQGGE
ncbi:MAG: DUF951 domain-containing protein [Abditibacteriales bacterium]|nr:DUF951 domain-containing protein [Abditibacteriales bacterium]MDW8364599.1 DUF951 domain-containing protein [Abditibacteriales bacterium]